MRGHDDVTPALGTPGSGGRFPHDAPQQTHPAGTQPHPAGINLDSPLIGSSLGQITMCACTDFGDVVDLDDPLIVEESEDDNVFEQWAIWPGSPESLWAASGHAVGDLRNPPVFVLRELSRTDS